MDRRCSFCKVAMNHTRGAHAVSSQNAAYYCSQKCRRRGRVQEAAGAVANIRLDDQAAMYPDSQGPVDWLQLPRNVVREVQGRLELPDLLQMALTCKAWLSCVAQGLTAVRMVVAEEEGDNARSLSSTVYLLDRLLPSVTSLALTLHSTPDTSTQIQVISRSTRLQHLDLRLEGQVNYYYGHPESQQLQWLPALARLTGLRTLSLALFENMVADLRALALLTRLTRLHLGTTGRNGVWGCCSSEEEVEALVGLPLEHLEVVDRFLQTPELSRLTHLTHLAITHFDASGHSQPSDNGVELPTYMAHYCGALARLPRLQTLVLATMDWESVPARVGEQVLATLHTGYLLEAAARWLHVVPELRLDVGVSARMWATADSMDHLAALTNLTSLRLVLTGWRHCMHTGRGLAPLGALSRLRHLHLVFNGCCLDKHGNGADGYNVRTDADGNMPPVIRDHHLRALGVQLQQLTQLELVVDPCWLWPGLTALRHVSKLRGLRSLSLRVAPDSWQAKGADWLAGYGGLPRQYVPSTVQSLQLSGFHLV